MPRTNRRPFAGDLGSSLSTPDIIPTRNEVDSCLRRTKSDATHYCGALIDRARELWGSYFLTYHRWATREQVEECHPRFRAFLDPAGTLWSDCYEHHLRLFGLGG